MVFGYICAVIKNFTSRVPKVESSDTTPLNSILTKDMLAVAVEQQYGTVTRSPPAVPLTLRLILAVSTSNFSLTTF